MVFRYRGFHMLATEPHVRPVVVRVIDPMRPTEEFDEFCDVESFDAAVGRASAFVDGLCEDEVQRVSATAWETGRADGPTRSG